MRVAYISADPGVPVFGSKGCSVHVQEVVRAFVRQDARVHLVTCRAGGPRPPGLEDITLHQLPAPTGDPAAREHRAQQLNRLVAEALRSAGPFDLVYERYSLWSHAAMDWARAARVPGVLEVNAPLVSEQADHRNLVDRVGAERVAALVFARASLLVAVSEGVRHYLERCGVDPARIAVIPNGVDPDRFPVTREPRETDRQFTVGFLGTLKPWHGLSVLLDAFDRLSRRQGGCRLLVVGDGPERARLEAMTRDRGIEHQVVFTGQVSPAQVAGHLASMDCAVAPYEDLPGFYFSPLKVYEYLAAGLPVVASRVGELAGVIRPDDNGLLVTPGDAAALATALERLRRSPALRARLGRSARDAALQEHTWDARVRQIRDLAMRSRAEAA